MGVIARPRAGHRLARPPSGRFTINRNSPQANGLVGWWPMLSGGGSIVKELSNRANDGIFIGSSVWSGADELGLVPFFGGSSDYVNILSTQLAGAFNGQEGTFSIWVKVFNSGVWTDSTERYILNLYADGQNFIRATKPSSDNQIRVYYKAGNVQKLFATANYALTTWLHLTATWSLSRNIFRVYINGNQVGSDITGLGTFVGSLAFAFLGSLNATPNAPWYGWLTNLGIYNRALSTAEAYQLYAPETRYDLYQPVAPPRFWSVPAGGPATLNINVNENITVTESRTITLPDALAINKSETITITESTKMLLINQISISENITITENIERLLTNIINISETISITETTDETISDLEINVSDNIAVSESIGVTVIEVGLITINVNDTIIITESVTTNVQIEVDVLDNIAVSENISITIVEVGTLLINVSDIITLTEVVTADIQIEIDVSDTIIISESIETLLEVLISVFDSISISELVGLSVVIGDLEINVSDIITISENALVTLPDALVISTSDTITIAELFTIAIIGLIVAGNVIITDTIIDGVTISDIGISDVTISDGTNG